MDDVYNGCHGHHFPEIFADKHIEHVVQVRAPVPLDTVLNSCKTVKMMAFRKGKTVFMPLKGYMYVLIEYRY